MTYLTQAYPSPLLAVALPVHVLGRKKCRACLHLAHNRSDVEKHSHAATHLTVPPYTKCDVSIVRSLKVVEGGGVSRGCGGRYYVGGKPATWRRSQGVRTGGWRWGGIQCKGTDCAEDERIVDYTAKRSGVTVVVVYRNLGEIEAQKCACAET